jgi:hypothetical protein
MELEAEAVAAVQRALPLAKVEMVEFMAVAAVLVERLVLEAKVLLF